MAALHSATDAGSELAALYSAPGPLDADGIRRAARLVEEAGGRRWALAEADVRIINALAHLADALPDPATRTDLTALCDLITHRDH
ncbi:hypothetical protein [Streptomyces sp. MNP-20]|uniref:hypothetical protein n=1 Tax=Streptomyces sp. MNP-20 TaxID=2721165 RepID=UPI0020A6D364|nr:hypothetical protein [Streptomyces sp. MNP-20]